MSDHSSKTTTPGHDNIVALQKGLTNITHIIARRRGDDALTEELSHNLSELQNRLTDLEQELTTQALEQDELAALYDISQAIGSSLDLTEVLNEVIYG